MTVARTSCISCRRERRGLEQASPALHMHISGHVTSCFLRHMLLIPRGLFRCRVVSAAPERTTENHRLRIAQELQLRAATSSSGNTAGLLTLLPRNEAVEALVVKQRLEPRGSAVATDRHRWPLQRSRLVEAVELSSLRIRSNTREIASNGSTGHPTSAAAMTGSELLSKEILCSSCSRKTPEALHVSKLRARVKVHFAQSSQDHHLRRNIFAK